MKVRALVTAFLLMGVSSAALAATDGKTLTVNSTVSARASLVIATTTVNFPDADPSSVASIEATEGPVTVTASVRTGSSGSATLQVQANGDLVSGSDTIDISNVTWTASGTGFSSGIMNKSVSQPAGSWTGSGQRTGTFNYFLANSWNYATGSYTTTLTYTLTAP
jgi:hypothetical protein